MSDVLRIAQSRKMAASGEARRIRERANLTQAEVAKPVGVSTVTVTRWEAGQRRPRGPAALRYLRVLQQLAAAYPDPSDDQAVAQ